MNPATIRIRASPAAIKRITRPAKFTAKITAKFTPTAERHIVAAPAIAELRSREGEVGRQAGSVVSCSVQLSGKRSRSTPRVGVTLTLYMRILPCLCMAVPTLT